MSEKKRKILLDLLVCCEEPQQALFKKMYSHGNLDFNVDQVVTNMEASKLDWAIKQCERTLAKNQHRKDNPVVEAPVEVQPEISIVSAVPKTRFTAEEVEQLVREAPGDVQHGDIDGTRRYNTSIVNYEGKYYAVYWIQELSESWPDTYEEQDMLEVERLEQVVPVTSWIPKAKSTN